MIFSSLLEKKVEKQLLSDIFKLPRLSGHEKSALKFGFLDHFLRGKMAPCFGARETVAQKEGTPNSRTVNNYLHFRSFSKVFE